MKTAIIYTTFLRDKLMYRTTQSIVDNYTKDCILLIADQGYQSDKKIAHYDWLKSQIPCEIYYLPFDCGAYTARNYLIRIANEKKIPYSLITADSIEFTQTYDFQPFIDFLEQDKNTALVGFELENSKCAWEYLMELTPEGFKFSYSNEWTETENIKYLKIDICRNIYLAKTSVLLNCPYDESLKLGGHELNFWNLKQKGYKCYWTNHYTFLRNSDKFPEYEIYRKRLGEFRKKMKQKLGITGWVIYPKNKCK